MATKNIEDLCRICVQESQSYQHIFSKCIEDAYLFEVINALCHIDISASDGLPEYICNECFDKVLSFHKFQKTCHDGKAALISIKMKYSETMPVDPKDIKTEVFMDEIDYNEEEEGVEGGMKDATEDAGEKDGPLESPPEETELGCKDEEDDESPRDMRVEESKPSSIIPVGLVKCPRDKSSVDETDIVSLPVPHSSARSEMKGTDGSAVSKAKDLSQTEMSLPNESVLPNGVEDYQIGGVRPGYVQQTAVDYSLSNRRREAGDNVESYDQSYGESGDSYVIKRIYNGTDESPSDLGFPYMGRGQDRSRIGYKCPHCGKSISRRFDFESHLRIHSGIKPFECHICHATFNLKKRLKAHMNVHSEMKLFICAYCQRKFKSKDALRLHIYVHTGEKLPDRPSKPSEVWCEVCGLSVLESCLAYHMQTHSRDLECQVCGEMCKDAEDVEVHRVMHDHVKKFQCKKCGKRYGLKGNLAQHMMVHVNEKQFACKTCGVKFYTNSRLRRHEQVHSSERNVICSECGRAFKTKYYLHQHLKTHLPGEAPHVCLTCGQRYKWPGDLRKHCRIKNHQH